MQKIHHVEIDHISHGDADIGGAALVEGHPAQVSQITLCEQGKVGAAV
jgi:hypothetical protein